METLELLGLLGVGLCVLNLAFIATLPTVLFKPGVKGPGWWLTASPLVLAGCGLLAGTLGVGGIGEPRPVQGLGAMLALLFAAGSMGLIAWAGRAHRTGPALWHQEDDRPAELVTWGPYRHVRHPLYAAFLLTLVACVLAAPGLATTLALVGGSIQLSRTARREERRISASPMGTDYAEYVARTGRFVPRNFIRG